MSTTDPAPTQRLACPICGGDICEHRIAAWERNSAMLQALWDVAWHTARRVTLYVGGTHVNYNAIEVGEYEFIDTEGEDRLIEWGQALRHREANAPLPKPRAGPETSPGDSIDSPPARVDATRAEGDAGG